MAVTDCVLARIPDGPAVPRAGGSLLAASDEMLREVVTRFALLAHLDAPAQVRWFFHWLALRTGRLPGQALEVPMSRGDIADFLAVAPETVSRAMRTLEERGELRREGLHTCRLAVDRSRAPGQASGEPLRA